MKIGECHGISDDGMNTSRKSPKIWWLNPCSSSESVGIAYCSLLWVTYMGYIVIPVIPNNYGYGLVVSHHNYWELQA